MKPCRECGNTVSEQARTCPQCGAPYPFKAKWEGYGFEYKTKAAIGNLPLLHISFKYGFNRVPVPAKGVIAIGQFAWGIVAIGQFACGLLCLSQFAFAAYAMTQIGVAYSLIAQVGLYFGEGYGQAVTNVLELLKGQ